MAEKPHERLMAFQRADELARACLKLGKASDSFIMGEMRQQALQIPAYIAAASAMKSPPEAKGFAMKAISSAARVSYLVSLAGKLKVFSKQATQEKMRQVADEVLELVRDFWESLSL